MAKSKNLSHGGFSLDVWCEPEEELKALQEELKVTPKEDKRRAALLSHELGRIYLANANETAAADALLHSYTLRPQFRPTLRLARMLYRLRADDRLVAKLLEAESRATQDPFARTITLRQQARLLWSRQNKTTEAIELLETAYQLDADLATLKLLELIYAQEGNVDGLRSVLFRFQEVISEKTIRASLLTGLALWSLRTGPQFALEILLAAEKDVPDDLSVLCYLEQLHEMQGSHVDLAEILVKQAERQPPASPQWRAKLFARAARIYHEQAHQPEEAIPLFSRSLNDAPVMGVAADYFELLLQQNLFAEAVKVGGQLFEFDDTPSFRASLASRIADIYQFHLNDPANAATWYAQCLHWIPSYQPALEGLGGILERTGEIDQLLQVHQADLSSIQEPRILSQRFYRVADLLERYGRDNESVLAHYKALKAWPSCMPSRMALERLLTRLERWSDLYHLYEEELAEAPEQERMVHLWITMAIIAQHHLDAPATALDCYCRAIELEPHHLHLLEDAARIAIELHQWDEVINFYEQELKLTDNSRRQLELLHNLGEIWEDQNLNLDQAIECYSRALAIDPNFLPGLKALGRIYRQKGRWMDLIEMHKAEIQVSGDPDQIVNLLYEIGEIYEEELLDTYQSANAYRLILHRKPNEIPALAILSRLLEHQADWKQLAELLESSIDSLPDNKSKALQLWRAGVIYEERLDNLSLAIKNYSRALRLNPHLLPAQIALSRLLEEDGQFHQLSELYQTALEQAENISAQVSYACRLADIWSRFLDNPRRAASFYGRAVKLQPAPANLWPLAQLYRNLGLNREFITTLQRLIPHIQDDQTIAALNYKIGLLAWSYKMEDPLPYFRRALDHPSTQTKAGRALEIILKINPTDDHLLSDLLEDRIDKTTDPFEAARLWAEIAEIHLRQKDTLRAEQFFQKALKLDPAYLSAFWGLKKIFEDQERWEEIAELSEKVASRLDSSELKADTLFAAGNIWEEKVKARDRAISVYEKVYELKVGHADTYHRLHTLFVNSHNWPALVSLLRNQITTTHDLTTLVSLFIELAKLYLEQLAMPAKAMTCLRRVLDLDSTHVWSVSTLGQWYFEQGKWKRALEMFLRAEELTPEFAERRHICHQIGDIYVKLSQPALALKAFQRATTGILGQEDPELLRKISQVAEECGDYKTQVVTLSSLADCSLNPEERVQIRRRIAHLAETVLHDMELAIRTLREILALMPLDITAIEQLAAIYSRMENQLAFNHHLQVSLDYHRAALARNPFDGQLYKQLGRIYRWQRYLDRVYCTCLVQFYLGTLEERDQQFFSEHHWRCATLPQKALSRNRYEMLILPSVMRVPLRKFLSAIQPFLLKWHAIKPSSLDLHKDDLVKPNHPIFSTCTKIATLFGGGEIQIWISQNHPHLIRIEALPEPTLILGERVGIGGLSSAERFRIGQELFHLAENTMGLRDKSVAQVRSFFIALCQAAQPSCSLWPVDSNHEQVEAELKLLLKRLNRKDRKLLGNILPKLISEIEDADISSYFQGLRLGSYRAGMLAAGDPTEGLDEAALALGNNTNGPEMANLLQYLVSEEYFTLRFELGLIPGKSSSGKSQKRRTS